MKVKDIMTRKLVTVSFDASIRSVADLMAKDDIGAIPVLKGTELQGIITDRDIVIRALGKNLALDTPIGQIVSKGLVTCHEDDDVTVVARDMKDRKVRRVIVLDQNDKPVGVVSLGDIAAHGLVKLAAEALEKVSEPVHSK